MKPKKFWYSWHIYLLEIGTAALLVWVTAALRPSLLWGVLPLAALAVGYTVYRFVRQRQDLYYYLNALSEKLNLGQTGEHLFSMPMAALIVSDADEIVWYNDAFRQQVCPKEDLLGLSMRRITYTPVEKFKDYPGHVIPFNDRYFKVFAVSAPVDGRNFDLYFFADVTDLQNTYHRYFASRPVILEILVDSYDEIMKNIKESERSRIVGEINTLLEKHVGAAHGFLRVLAQDRFVAIVEKQYFDEMAEHRFPILDESKNIITSERISVTLSMGISYVGETFEDNERYAKQALEMSLGRGGDQIAVKTPDGFQFYGGVSQGIEKRTKVKSRILASAMLELIQNSPNVLVMGHRFADLDAIGSAIGMAKACKPYTPRVNIVVDRNKCLARNLIERQERLDGASLFVDPEKALELLRKDTLLFIVDTHSPHLLECEELYRRSSKVVVIDHHRRMVDCVDDAVIFFHEPYTSSASEMVTELVQYIGEKVKLEPHDAEALLAGIMLDTKDFVMKTGVRTFEAAAYLKKMGANSIEVKKLFSGPMEDYIERSKLVSQAEIYRRCALVFHQGPLAQPRLIAPQAADELLHITGVDASFVLYQLGDQVCINARSMGNINVQVIMEDLGGGGHQTMAAAQVNNAAMDGVRRLLLKSIDEHVSP